MLDKFNLKGLNKYVPNLNKYAEVIYGMLHARYIQASKGMKQMVNYIE